ncbi:TPA: hypothetical protein N0F65_011468 [Lagenidium giganteum]|uniref:Transposase n=1 Tax=Lagenidium giganteum TaxID=4803 RepID=A0AAV2ZE41_9STRA|nr:TPA: hypothetical protein N0F65_011468 [Lagenidium giganteum]
MTCTSAKCTHFIQIQSDCSISMRRPRRAPTVYANMHGRGVVPRRLPVCHFKTVTGYRFSLRVIPAVLWRGHAPRGRSRVQYSTLPSIRHIIPLLNPWTMARSIVVLDNARIHMYKALHDLRLHDAIHLS